MLEHLAPRSELETLALCHRGSNGYVLLPFFSFVVENLASPPRVRFFSRVCVRTDSSVLARSLLETRVASAYGTMPPYYALSVLSAPRGTLQLRTPTILFCTGSIAPRIDG